MDSEGPLRIWATVSAVFGGNAKRKTWLVLGSCECQQNPPANRHLLSTQSIVQRLLLPNARTLQSFNASIETTGLDLREDTVGSLPEGRTYIDARGCLRVWGGHWFRIASGRGCVHDSASLGSQMRVVCRASHADCLGASTEYVAQTAEHIIILIISLLITLTHPKAVAFIACKASWPLSLSCATVLS